MNSSQRAVMRCGWGVKAGMACLQVKLCVAISKRFRKCIWYLKALHKYPGLLHFTCGKCQTMSHIVNSCPQTKLEGAAAIALS